MEGRLNQIQSSKTLWLDNKALTYGLQMNCLFFIFTFVVIRFAEILCIQLAKGGVERACMYVCGMCDGTCVSYNQFHYMGMLHFICSQINRLVERRSSSRKLH